MFTHEFALTFSGETYLKMFSYEDSSKTKHVYYFHEDGIVAMHIVYKDGKREGNCELYYMNGKLEAVIEYKHDKKVMSQHYPSNGELPEITFKDL